MSTSPDALEERLRLFVALELPVAVREALLAWRAGAAGRIRGLRLLDPAALHVTLCFLGWQRAAALEPIANVLRVLEGNPAPELALGEARWLPARRPRVLAVEVEDPTGALRAAQSALSAALAEGGWYQPEKRPYLAHVTVARVAHGKRISPERLPPPPAPVFLGGRVTLYRSRLYRSGARYEPLANLDFGGRPNVAPLIGAQALAGLLRDATSAPTILDVRWQLSTGADREAYALGHIPGAVFVDLDRQLSDPPSAAGRHPLPSTERFTAEMQALGVSTLRPVVVYDAGNATAAARAWWLLRYFGHPHVTVLDGGLAAWVEAGGELVSDAPDPAAGDFVARAGGMPVITAAEAGAFPAAGVLLDARAPERFSGAYEPIDSVAGHIPGARNRPTTDNVDPSGRFLEPAALREGFARVGVSDAVPVAAYCGSGITATHEVLALALAGYHAALYPGSWSEWITDPDRPVARAEGP